MADVVTLKSALPILNSKKKAILLMTCNRSLHKLVINPDTSKISQALDDLYTRGTEQRRFPMLKWGKVKKRSMENVLQEENDYLAVHHDEDHMKASIMNVYGAIKYWHETGMDADIFEIVWFD